MKLVIICLIVCVVCLVEVNGSNNRLLRFLKRLNFRRLHKSTTGTVLIRLRQRARGFLQPKSSSSGSNNVVIQDPRDVECKSLEDLYDDLCFVRCSTNDYMCIRVYYRYIRPLCVLKDARKAGNYLISRIGCDNMNYRAKRICNTRSKDGCEYAEEVADFCEAGLECVKKTAEATTEATTTEVTTEATTTESTTTEATTTESTTTEATTEAATTEVTTEATTTESTTTEATTTEATTEAATTEAVTTAKLEITTVDADCAALSGVCAATAADCPVGTGDYGAPPCKNGYVCCF